jgi:hypothetical protein
VPKSKIGICSERSRRDFMDCKRRLVGKYSHKLPLDFICLKVPENTEEYYLL